MRHRKSGRKLSRTASHRQALRRNLAKALFTHERIITTAPKAKEARRFIERLITLARKALPYKDATGQQDRARYLHYYRLALKKLQDKKLVQKLFGEGAWREEGSLAERFATRPGGYTRIVKLSGSRLGVPLGATVGSIPELSYELAGAERTLKLVGNRLGDNASRVVFELVGAAVAPEEAAPAVAVSEDVKKKLDQPVKEPEAPAEEPPEAAADSDTEPEAPPEPDQEIEP